MSLPTALSGIGAKKKQNSKVDEIVTVEIKDWFPPTATTFHRFDLQKLIKEQTGQTGEDDNPHGDNEEYQKLESIARKFEEKYGSKRDKKGRKVRFGKPEDYMDLGMGYDHEDSFIDDSEAYDELVPSNLEPILGGFYVNKGPLEFREIADSDDEREVEGSKNKGYPAVPHDEVSSEDESSSENSGSDSDQETTTPNKSAENLPNGSSDHVGPSAITEDEVALPIKRKRGRPSKMTPKQKASASLLRNSKGWARKTKKSRGEKSDSFMHRLSDLVNSVATSSTPVPNGDRSASVRSKDRPSIRDSPTAIESTIQALITGSVDAAKKQVKPETASSSNNQTRPKVETEIDGVITPKIDLIKKTPTTESKDVRMPKPISSQADSNATPLIDLTEAAPTRPRLIGKPPTCDKSTTKTTTEGKPRFVVPAHLQELNALLVQRAKENGQLSFSGRTDVVLHKIMDGCRSMNLKEHETRAVLDNLSARLKIKTERVLVRWDKIKGNKPANSPTRTTPAASVSAISTPSPAPTSRKSSDAELGAASVTALLHCLRQEIERQMPALELDHRKLADEVALKKLELIQGTGSEGERQKNVYTPRRKYAWNDRSRKLLGAIVSKLMKVVTADRQISDKEEALKIYLEQHVVPAWPQGWMNARELMKESKELHARTIRPTEIMQQQADVTKSETDSATSKNAVGVSTISSSQAAALKGNSQATASVQSSSARVSTAAAQAISASPSTVVAKPISAQSAQTQSSSVAAKPRTPSVTSPVISPQRLGFSIQNLTSSAVGTSANSSMTSMTSAISASPSSSSNGRTWTSPHVPTMPTMDYAQQQRLQMEFALMMAAAANQGHTSTPNSSSWFTPPRQ